MLVNEPVKLMPPTNPGIAVEPAATATLAFDEKPSVALALLRACTSSSIDVGLQLLRSVIALVVTVPGGRVLEAARPEDGVVVGAADRRPRHGEGPGGRLVGVGLAEHDVVAGAR
jgi:hypothetical protein